MIHRGPPFSTNTDLLFGKLEEYMITYHYHLSEGAAMTEKLRLDTIPLSPYRLASSAENLMFPFSRVDGVVDLMQWRQTYGFALAIDHHGALFSSGGRVFERILV